MPPIVRRQQIYPGCFWFPPILISPFHLLLAFDIPPLSGSPLASAQASLPPTSPPRGITTTPSPILPGLSLHIVNPLLLSLLPPSQLISVGRAPNTDCGAGPRWNRRQQQHSAPPASEHHRCHHTRVCPPPFRCTPPLLHPSSAPTPGCST